VTLTAALVRFQLVQSIEPDANPDRDEGAKAAVNPGTKLDPLFAGFRAGRRGDDKRQP
jgi:hypothetical protein